MLSKKEAHTSKTWVALSLFIQKSNWGILNSAFKYIHIKACKIIYYPWLNIEKFSGKYLDQSKNFSNSKNAQAT